MSIRILRHELTLKATLQQMVLEFIMSSLSTASRNIISSHSWKVDLSSKDGYAEVAPQMKSVDANAFSLEDPDMAEHGGFRNYWEPDD